ncbi:MAG: PIN domain-containing protein [Luteolibacter sp.]
MLSTDTNLLIYAADSESPNQEAAIRFFENSVKSDEEFVLCELVLVEVYMQLRNPAIFPNPQSAEEASNYCRRLRIDTGWRHIDYDPAVSAKLWKWASSTQGGIRQIIDARLALTLRHHGVTRFATANVKQFQGFGFTEVWNPLLQ